MQPCLWRFLPWRHTYKGKPIAHNRATHVFCGINFFIVASAAEAELGALFLNCKEGKIIHLILEELGHNQPPTLMHCGNTKAAGIANNTVKKQQSRSMEMNFFWITDQVRPGKFNTQWHTGKENLVDYSRNIFVVIITKRYALGTYTRTIILTFHHVQQRQSL